MKKLRIITAAVIAIASITLYQGATPAYAAPCTVPGTDYGTVTLSASVSAAGTYRIWTRMAAPNSSDNSYRLEVDGNTCFQVGGSGVPTYASGATTRFQSGTTNWRSTTTTGTQVSMSLASGAHTLKLIGISEGVVIDRVIITADADCVPTGTGDNCASIYISADINQDTNVNFLDFSLLSDKYTQSGAGIGRSDINSDGTVNFLDYSILASRYGQ